MKKRTLNAFTLVEMLIVIVIIGILIAALMPRMSAAQGRARDVARKTALSQIQSAIVTYQWDHWSWPQENSAIAWMAISIDTSSAGIGQDLAGAWMSSIPKDPLGDSSFKWLKGATDTIGSWQYGYIVTKKNWTAKWWFVLMAKTEVPWWSNWVVCETQGSNTLTWGYINSGVDINNIHLCQTVEKTGAEAGCSAADCKYYEDGELRYITLY